MNKMGGSIQLQLPHAQQFDSKLPAERLSEDHRVSPAGCRTLRVVRRVRGNNLGIVIRATALHDLDALLLCRAKANNEI